jgi:hypothetical protein
MIRLLMISAILAGAPAMQAADVAAPEGQLPNTVTPERYHLALSIDPRLENFRGQTVIEVEINAPLETIWLNGLGLKVKSASVTAGGRTVAARYEEVNHDTGVARLVTGAPLAAGKALLRLEYEAPFQSSPQGLYRTRVGTQWYAFSQMEAIDARRVFPGFDEPRFKTPFEISVTSSSGDLAITNTPQLSATASGGGTTLRRYETTKPLPTYLIAFAVGPLQVVEGPPVPPNDVRRKPLPLRVIGTQGDAARFRFALEQAPDLIRRLELYFGIAFPYPKIDLIASPIHAGAMENAGAIIFTESLLALDRPPTPRQQMAFGLVAAHELAHQWFGDLVTPAWWDDIWLNESFAEWMGGKIADQWRPHFGIEEEELVGTLAAMNTDALRAGRPIHQPVTRNTQISSTFDNITYQKGGGVIGMVESYLGEERFQRGVRLHLTRHAYGTATAAEFFRSMAEGSGDPAVIDAFESFVDQPGVPLVTVSKSSDGSLKLAQSRYRALGPSASAPEVSWKIPFCAHVYGAAQPSKLCMMLNASSGTLSVPAALRDAVVHPNANGSGYYRFTVDTALWQALLSQAPHLPAREAITLADSAAAAFDAGRLPFAGLYQAAQVLANHPSRIPALSLGYRLEDIHDRIATPTERPLIERALVQLYGERLHRLGYDATPGRYAAEPAEQQLLRRELLALVALTGHDATVRSALLPFADRSVTDPAAVEPLLRWAVWAVGLQERGAPFLAGLKNLATGPDAQVRQDAALAARYATPPITDEALALALDPALSTGSSIRIIFGQMTHPLSRDAAWRWLGDHEDAALARVPAWFQSGLAQVGALFCSAPQRQAFAAGLGAKLRPLNGGELSVDRALETSDDCIALRATLDDSITTTLQQALH